MVEFSSIRPLQPVRKNHLRFVLESELVQDMPEINLKRVHVGCLRLFTGLPVGVNFETFFENCVQGINLKRRLFFFCRSAELGALIDMLKSSATDLYNAKSR
jgi:hypothetical protein